MFVLFSLVVKVIWLKFLIMLIVGCEGVSILNCIVIKFECWLKILWVLICVV